MLRLSGRHRLCRRSANCGTDERSDTGAAVAKHGAVMALGSIVSRVTGFVRTAAIGAAIGVAAIGNDYSLANTLPGMVYELLLGGVLASVVVPLLVRARTRDADQGEAYAQRLLSLAVIFLAGATVVAVACAPLFTALLANDRTAAGRPRPDHHAVVPAAPHDLLLRHGGAVRGGAQHPRPLRDADLRADPEQPRRHRDVRRLRARCRCSTRTTRRALTGGQIAVLGLGTTLGIVVQAARAVAGAAPGRLPLAVAVGLPAAAPARARSGRAWMLAYVVVSQVGGRRGLQAGSDGRRQR